VMALIVSVEKVANKLPAVVLTLVERLDQC
jgi:hypothetical protein